MVNTIEFFAFLLRDWFEILHKEIFGTQSIQRLLFEKSNITIYQRDYKREPINFYLFCGSVEDFKKATSDEFALSGHEMLYFYPGLILNSKSGWTAPLHEIPAIIQFKNETIYYSCMYCYAIFSVNAAMELMRFLSHTFLPKSDLTVMQLSELCALMMCAHEIRHEIQQFSENIFLRTSFPETFEKIDKPKFLEYSLGMLENYQKKNLNEKWFDEEKDSIIKQAMVVDAWVKNYDEAFDKKITIIKDLLLS